jgi:hypothetical protein
MFAMSSQAYFKNPRKALESREGQDDTLGFGIETVLPLLTPIILAVATDVLKNLATRGIELAGR